MHKAHRRTFCVTLLACLALGVLTASGALAQSVVINGVPLVTTRTPLNVGGSILLPMRDVFEALNSEVKWFASEQKIMATRGNTVIQLWIGKRVATVNGQEVALPVAPSLIGGSTYVPLRFPAEAFNGNVKWVPETRTVLIDIPPAEGGSGTGPVTPPTTGSLEGTVIQVVPTPAGLLLQTGEAGALQAVQVSQTTTITRGPVGGQALPATLTDARPGDLAQVVLAEGNTARSVALSFGALTGKIVAIAGNTLVLEDGTALRLSDTVRVFDASGRTIALAGVAQNSTAQVMYSPQSRLVWEVRVTAPPPTGTTPPPTGAQPQILTLGVLNNTTYFKRNDVVNIQLTGTPGGQATVALGRMGRDLALNEVQPGVYQGNFTVPAGPDLRNQALSGNLIVGGVRAQPVISPTRLVIDNTPPVILNMLPLGNQTIANNSPTIELTFDQRGGAPLDPASARMIVNRVNVSTQVQVDQAKMTYVAENLPAGVVTVQASVRDLAGNEASVTWGFNIGVTADNTLQAAWHDARDVLVAGQVIAVSGRVVNAGGVATYSLGTLRTNLPMQRVGNTNTYRGTYTVRAGDSLVDGLVTVTYRDPQGRQGSMDATARVQINTGLPTALTIAQPLDGSAVGDTILVSGQAPPNRRIRVTITYATRVLTRITGQLWQGTVSSTNQGTWETQEIASSLGLLGRADEYTVKADLLNASNNVVSTQTVKLHK